MESNHNNEPQDLEPVLEPEKKAEKKQKRSRKEKRKEKRAAKKAAFKALSPKKKVFYFGKRFLAAFLLIAALFGIVRALFPLVINYRILKQYETLLTQEVSEEQLLEEAPIDRESADKVDAMKPYGADDTWAVYVYMCGSNLEGGTMNNLSDFSRVLLGAYSQEIIEENSASQKAMLTDYIAELTDQGMDVPDYMYLNTAMSLEKSEEEPEAAPQIAGSASNDIEEMTKVALSDKIKIVVQTGGSKAWNFAGANPNRSQRYMIDKDGMRLLEDNHFVNMGEVETLSDFFRFCEKTAPADHKIAVLWNHGSGAFGFASDDLYGGDKLTLKELRQAFDNVYPNNPKDPAFEIVGFDACLMASLETAESLYGYGKYLVGSEELEPGSGWNYTAWLSVLNENPASNGAQVGRAIADSFIEESAKRNVQLEPMNLSIMNTEVTFSVLDINETHEIYGHYCDLADRVLEDSIDNIDTLVTLGKAAKQTVRFGSSHYDIVNMIDLSNLVKNLRTEYPEETKVIMDCIDRAVVYNRFSKSMNGSKGISVYFPADIPDVDSLLYCLDYIENICPDDGIRALYYYKVSGCLSEEMQAYADSLGYGRARKLDNTALRNIQYGDIVIDKERFSMTLPEAAESLIQENTLTLAMMQDDYVVNLGEDELVKMEDGKLGSTFDGKWLFMGENILPVERVSAVAGTIKYRTKVEYNLVDSYMMFGVDEESGDVKILGIYEISEASESGGDAVVERNIKTVNVGDRLRIIYDKDSVEVGGHTDLYGPAFTYTENMKIGYENVEDGEYLATFSRYDMRGDVFYSPIVQYEIKGGKIVSVEHNSDFVVSASE